MRRVAGASGGLSPRILCLMGCPDPAAQYISVMNCLFSAQRANVVVDGCVLGNAESAFLQQAAHLTGGLYLRPPRLEVIRNEMTEALAYFGPGGGSQFEGYPLPSSKQGDDEAMVRARERCNVSLGF
jgi:hypothetical protein